MTDALYYLLPTLVAGGLSLALTPAARMLATAVGALDQPGPRKVHAAPIPRLGGLAVIASATLVLAAVGLLEPDPSRTSTRFVAIGLGLLPILVVSLWDDIASLRPTPKLAAHLAGAGIAVSLGVCLQPTIHLFGSPIQIGVLAVPFSILWLVAVTNAFNIIDGLDGLSGGLALISAVSLAAVFAVAHEPAMTRTALVLVGALVGFLPYNVYPARIFLGDSGATAIGFALGCMALFGGTTLSAGFATLVPLFGLIVPIADTVLSVLRRTLRRLEAGGGLGVFDADRGHIHHRLLALGLDHRKAVLRLYAVGAASGAVGLLSLLASASDAGLLLLGVVLAGGIGIARLRYEEFALIKRGVMLRVYDQPVLKRAFFAVFVDLAVVVLAAYLAVGLKFDDWLLSESRARLVGMVGPLVPCVVMSFWMLELYKGAWRVAGIADFVRLCWAVVMAGGAGFVIARLVSTADGSVFVIYTLLHLVFAAGLRVSYLVLRQSMCRANSAGTPVLIYGAGLAGANVLRELISNRETALKPVGFIDDDPETHGTLIHRVPVLGSIDELEALVTGRGIGAVVVASKVIAPDKLDRAKSVCESLGVWLFRMTMTLDRMSTRGPVRRRGAFARPAVRTVPRGLARAPGWRS